MLEPRHAGHHHSTDHSATSMLFLACLFSVLALYSCSCLIYGKLRPKRPYSWPCPPWAVTAVWVLFCIAAFIRHHNFDSVPWIARRAGRLSFAIAVFSQFLVLKPALLPRTYVVGLTFCHKWTGRTVVLLGLIHGLLYTVEYLKKGQFAKLLNVGANLVGIIALVCYIIMGITSLKFFRRRWYSAFFIPHAPLAFICTVLVFFHSRPSAAALVEFSIFFFVLALIFRLSIARSAVPIVTSISPTYDLVTLERKALPSHFAPGSHLRLSRKLTNPAAWITPSHPYTVASLDSDSDIKLVVKRTRWQVQSADTHSSMGPFSCPYDPLAFRKVVAVGGGAGLSFVAPIWRATKDSSDTTVKAVWVTRAKADLALLPSIGLDTCDVFITGSKPEESLDTPSAGAFELDDISEDEDNTRLLPKDGELGEGVTQHNGRPLFEEDFGPFLADTSPEDVSIIACGPETLIKDLKRWSTARGYNFFAEEYGT